MNAAALHPELILDSLFSGNPLAVDDAARLQARGYRLALAGQNISLQYASAELAEQFQQALAHLEVNSINGAADLALYVHDERSLPLQQRAVRDTLALFSSAAAAGGGQIESYVIRGKDSVLCLQWAEELLTVDYFSASSKQALQWTSSARLGRGANTEQLTSPFRWHFAWHFLQQRCLLLHASAVGTAKGAVLFVGPSGSGKSNTALHFLERGFFYAGDDSVLVQHEDAAQVHCVYASARAHRDDLPRFPCLSGALRITAAETADIAEKEKFFLFPSLAEQLGRALPLRAVVSLRRTSTESSLRPLSVIEALSRLAPNSMLHLPGMDERYLRALTGLLRSLPAYELELGSDRRAFEVELAPILAELQSEERRK